MLRGQDVTPQKIEFPGPTGALAAYLYLPPGDPPYPCVIDNHGSQPPAGGDLSHPQTAAFFLALGHAYLFPHRAGYGDSPGTRLADDVPAPRGTAEHDEQLSARLLRENDDVIAALDAIATRQDIDSARIAAMGSSLGGIHTLLALSRDTRWRCGLDFSGGASQWAGHPKIRAMLLDAARAITQPVFLIQPENDFDITPTREIAALLTELHRPHQAVIFPKWGVAGAEAHRFCATGQQIWGPRVAAFLERNF